jgi:WD40 repeat protein
VLENRIYVYKFVDLKLIDAIDTCINTRGLVALNPETPNEVLATPDKEVGHVRLTLYRKNKNHVIKAHENTIAAMALNLDGRLLATASEKGTLIRLTNTETGNALAEFRRGSDKADIYSLTFDVRTTWLAISSDKPTIHVFAVTKDITDQLGKADFGEGATDEEAKQADDKKNAKK